jgi:putative ABC transport system permease protein
MFNILKLAGRNLMRYSRRTILTSLLITMGIVAVLAFVSVSGSFKSMMIGQFTDSMLGHLQVHRKGYVASIDNLPLNKNMQPNALKKVENALRELDSIESWSPRIKFGAMYSDFNETTSIRLNAIYPDKEIATSPLLPGRLIKGKVGDSGFVDKGKVFLPEIIAKGMKVKVGDTAVLVANNQDGSVNGQTFMVQGVLEGISGPGGRDAYMHIDDARQLLRISGDEVSEIAIRLKNPAKLAETYVALSETLAAFKNKQDQPAFEVHTWEKLSPFSNIAKMIDLLTLFIKVMLVGIVLISIMNVMLMAVYERIREIGTISAIGTRPGKVLALFVSEGFLLGILGAVLGVLVSVGLIFFLNQAELTFSFGRQEGLILKPELSIKDTLIISIMVIVVSVLASLQPAWKASRMDPNEALRHV